MSRIETIGNATLYLGDCREIMPAIGRTDALISDPVWPNCPPNTIPGSDDPSGLWRSFWLAYVNQQCGQDDQVKRAAIVMRHDSDPRFLEAVPFPYLRAVILPYVMPGYIGRFLGGDEIAYCFGTPIPSRAGQRVIPGRAPSVQPDGRTANGHPCSRALEHFMFLVRWWSEPDEIVFDPFMGSGTTGVASLKLGRKFIGTEIEPAYFDIACRRIEDATRDLTIWTPEPPHQPELTADSELKRPK